ncbi:MAG: hypothetical protein H3C35_13395 [Bacteroidetes bacterium]|nr:hypothetical protein [Bacteroidota bacterium]
MTRVNVITHFNEVSVWVADEKNIVEMASSDGRWLRLLVKAFLKLKFKIK